MKQRLVKVISSMLVVAILYANSAAVISYAADSLLSDKELENMSWSDFVLKIGSDKPELIEYLKEKRLYVNEIAEEGVEA